MDNTSLIHTFICSSRYNLIHIYNSTERGGRTFPKRELLPFLQKIATDVKNEVNEANFKRYGETSL